MSNQKQQATGATVSPNPASMRCRRCGNLTSRFRCTPTACNGILPIEGGCSPLECMDAAAEIQNRVLAATGWDRSAHLPAHKRAEITEKALARVAADILWLAEHPYEDPSRIAWTGRLRALARNGVTPIYSTPADCGPKPPEPTETRTLMTKTPESGRIAVV